MSGGARRFATSSSKQWLTRHVNDKYVQQATQQELRSRSAFKLLQINERHKFLKSNAVVIDLGSSPGGWSLAARRLMKDGDGGCVIAVDLLPMEPIPGVTFLQGDFTRMDVQESVREAIIQGKVRPIVVLSDMLHNTTGNGDTDHLRSMDLLRAVRDFLPALQPCSSLTVLAKYYQGRDEKELLDSFREYFSTVKLEKPDASRKSSREIFLFATSTR